ncbi:hypothetical protein GCM10019059_42980 [Camelimonas fluminis]|uniref:Ig-like domain-containing protein n=1 Tax=Camelimonas fluminis TaxID=1576911 RepID=A0ABV7UNQ2_9HYPH|nr:Ig-like domain-containing protein [Camelimonas fluminis]GHE79977.1 hypothetical protein GCM10019059_42980 [Camelimonas fluminis]
MKATVFPKADHAAPEAFNGSRIALGAPSVVQLQMGPERVAQYKRHGNDLLLTLDDGTVLTIENFFVMTPSGRNDLVFRDGDDVTWWAQYGEAWTGFDIAEINSGDATAPLALPLPLLAGLGLLAGGLGGALALGGGGGGGGGGAAAVNVPLNAPPTGVAGPDPARTAEDTPLGGMVRGSDPDGDRLIYTLGGDGPRHGVVTVNPDGTYTYTPNADYHGPDSFDVIISDGRGCPPSAPMAQI